MRFRLVCVSLAAAVAAVPVETSAAPPPSTIAPAPAESVELTKAHRLDELFDELQASGGTPSGKVIEKLILIEWHHTGDSAVDAMFNAALMAMGMRAFSTAIEMLDKVIAARPDFAEGWNKRATVYYYVNQYDRSLADIERTLVLEPRHFGALAGLGMIMQDTGNIPGAIAAFERAVAVNPTLTNLKEAIEQLKARISRDI